MDKVFEIIGDRFVGFFTRSVAPSSVFFILLFFNDKFFNNSDIYNTFIKYIEQIKDINEVFLYITLTLIFISYGYINQIFSQFLDNFIKSNYDFLMCDAHDEYRRLREKVKNKLVFKEKEIFNTIEFNDYNAYQVLGKNVDSRSYVDVVKSIHTIYIGLVLNIFLFHFGAIGIVLIGVLFVLDHLFAKTRYMARNKRMYINYLVNKNRLKLNIGIGIVNG